MTTRVLITGGSGDLGKALVERFKHEGCEVFAPSHLEMDVKDHDKVFQVIDDIEPHFVIHTAAIIDARKCEDKWVDAEITNVDGTYNVASAAYTFGAKMIHVSSTCVFDGEHAPFNEKSKPCPRNWYAITKYAAEQMIMVSMQFSHPLIIRTNFVARKPWKYPKAFTDRFGTYLFADDVAYGIYKYRHMDGVVHICGDRRMSMFELARMVSPDVQPMTLAEYQGPHLSRDMSLASIRVNPLIIGGAP